MSTGAAGAAGGGSGGSGGEAATFWEEHYRGKSTDWGVEPNPALVHALAGLDLAPGAALDLGAGHGGDACWLARQGWTVTAVDVSATAASRVARLAGEQGVGDRVRTEVHDVTRSLPAGAVALVTASYLHLPSGRAEALQRAWSQLAADGVLVVVDHGSAPPWSWADPDTLFPSPAETLAALDLDVATPDGRALRVERLERLVRTAVGPARPEDPEPVEAEVVDTVVVVRSVRA